MTLFHGAVHARFRRMWIAFSIVAILAACGGTETETPASASKDAEVVARFGDLEITVAEVDARVLSLPPTERPAPGADLDSWYTETIREMVVDARLRAEAEENRLADDPGFSRAREEAEKQAGLQLCLATLRPELARVDADELAAAYRERIDTFTAPERRFVYHLFLRRPDDASESDLRAEIEELRGRVLRGDSFSRLAAERSDSESRHRDGVLGWVTPGVLPAGFESVVFALAEGVPSEPVATRDGLHLFYVDQVLPGRTLELAEAGPRLKQVLVAERQAAALEELQAEIEAPAGSLVLDREEFAAVVAANDPDAVVLRIGETELDFGDLRQALGRPGGGRAAGRSARGSTADVVPENAAWQALEQLRLRALLHHHCRETGKIPAEALAERMAAWSDATLLNLQRRRRMIDIAERDESRLRLFYQSNIGDFSSRPRWHVRRLEVPLGADPAAAMARLEEAAASRSHDLEALAEELDGRIEDLGFVDLATLRRHSTKLPGLVTPLEPGEMAAPVRLGDRLEAVELLSRREAEPLAFEEIRGRVAAAFVDQYTHEVYGELSAEILGDGSRLEIDAEALAALREAGLPRSEVTVEDLETLIEEL